MLPPTCGLISTPGACHSGWPGGSGSGSVTSSAALSRPDSSSASSALVSTTGPRATFTSSAPSFIAARNGASTRPPGVLGERRGQHHHVGARQQSGQRRRAACTGPRGAVRARAGHPHHVALEGRQPVLDRRADRRRTRRSGPCGRRAPGRSPAYHFSSSWPRTKRGMPRSEARIRARASSAVLASCTPRALHSRTPGGSREVRRDVVHARGQRLHDADARIRAQRRGRGDRALHVRDDVEGGVGRVGGEVPLAVPVHVVEGVRQPVDLGRRQRTANGGRSDGGLGLGAVASGGVGHGQEAMAQVPRRRRGLGSYGVVPAGGRGGRPGGAQDGRGRGARRGRGGSRVHADELGVHRLAAAAARSRCARCTPRSTRA